MASGLAVMHYALDASGRDFGPFAHHPSVEALDRLFARYGADLVCYGHNHAASDIQGVDAMSTPARWAAPARP